MQKLAIVITHPIQYYVPVFRLLAEQCTLKVFYTWGEDGSKAKYDPDFKKIVDWDLPLLDGYDYELLKNVANHPGSHHRKGIINPDLNVRIKDFYPDAILIYGWNYDSHWKAMRYFKGKIPIWFRGDSTLLDDTPGLKKWLKKAYLKWVYSYIDKAFYVGTNNKAYFKAYGLKERQLVFAPHAIDNNRFAEKRNPEVDVLRDSLGVRKDDILILFAGKLEQKKNPELLLNAFVALARERALTLNEKGRSDKDMTTLQLLFVGNGALEPALKRKASEVQSVTKNIHFLDFRNQLQMPVVYQACDIFCLPSQGPGETWGLAVNEAMAAGKAILVSNRVGCSLDLVNERNGKIFISNSLTSLKQSLSEILENDLNILALESRKIIDNWNFEIQTKSIINEFKKN